MKIAIISDSHLGFGSGTEREDDAFDAFQEALERSLDCDIILLPGDIFDTKIPSPETLAGAMEILIKPKLKRNQVRVLEGTKKLDRLSPLNLSGIPLVAIHGTHERRAKGSLNPVQALERAGFLLYLHCNSLVFDKMGEKVAIHGLSGVPDQYAEGVLKEWNPRPVPGAKNILVLHQTLSGFVPAPHTLQREALPRGFDMIIDGHLHEPKHDGNLLIAGSIIQTSLGKESSKPRGFWVLDTEKMVPEFHTLESQRPVYYIKSSSPEELRPELERILSSRHPKKPIVRVRLTGDDFSKDIQSRFGEDLLLSFKKDVPEEKPAGKTLEEQKLSVEEMGKKLLSRNLKEAGLEPGLFEEVCELLQEKMPDDALKLLRGHLNQGADN